MLKGIKKIFSDQASQSESKIVVPAGDLSRVKKEKGYFKDAPETLRGSELSLLVLRPIITEKSTSLETEGKYVFEVLPKSTKQEVKKAIEKFYSVKVNSVRMINTHGKVRKVGRHEGRVSGKRKAIVTINKEQKIDLTI